MAKHFEIDSWMKQPQLLNLISYSTFLRLRYFTHQGFSTVQVISCHLIMSTSRRFPGCPLISSRNNTRESLDLGSWMTFLKIQKNIPTRWCDDTCYTCAFNGTKPIVYWMSNSATWSFQKSHFTCLVGNLWRFHGFGIFFFVPKFCSDCWIIARFGSGTGKSPASTWGRSFNISMEGRPGI